MSSHGSFEGLREADHVDHCMVDTKSLATHNNDMFGKKETKLRRGRSGSKMMLKVEAKMTQLEGTARPGGSEEAAPH